jgi:predicted aldo/keto reductase-like oxidoreductase
VIWILQKKKNQERFAMSVSDQNALDRREWMKVSAAGVAATAVAGSATAQEKADEVQKVSDPVPTRPLGRSGIPVSMLNLGTWRNPGLDRLLRFSYANGVRYLDTAKSYGSEPAIGRWLKDNPDARKNIFLVTKDHPNTPDQLIKQLDERLAALQTDYVDLFFIHGIGDSYGKDYKSLDWPKSKEWKDAFEKIKKSGKAKLVGFSCHDQKRTEFLESAAQGGFVDAIMVQYSPWLDKDAPLNRALDACHKAGIGLISMKQVAGTGDNILNDVPKHVPYLKEKKLSAYQGLLHAIWSDERISSVCVSMRNTDQIRENTSAIKSYEPMKLTDIHQLRDAVLACGKTLCADCTGQCATAGGTKAKLGDLTRLLTYHEDFGYRSEAKRMFREMDAESRDWADADLAAAEAACPNKLKFSSLLPRVNECLS